jgi:hypothetical protein
MIFGLWVIAIWSCAEHSAVGKRDFVKNRSQAPRDAGIRDLLDFVVYDDGSSSEDGSHVYAEVLAKARAKRRSTPGLTSVSSLRTQSD